MAKHDHGADCDHDHDHGPAQEPFVRTEPKLGRNDPCHCGSGKKYKKCHALVAAAPAVPVPDTTDNG